MSEMRKAEIMPMEEPHFSLVMPDKADCKQIKTP